MSLQYAYGISIPSNIHGGTIYGSTAGVYLYGHIYKIYGSNLSSDKFGIYAPVGSTGFAYIYDGIIKGDIYGINSLGTAKLFIGDSTNELNVTTPIIV